MSYYFNLEIIVLVSALFAVFFSIATRRIQYHGPNTDNEIMAHAAAQSYKWRWLSDIHKFTVSPFKTAMRDVSVILISVFQKILRDKETDHAYVTLGGATVALSSVLIFLISSNYWNPAIGLFLGLFLILSFWLWEVSLNGSHNNVTTVLSLLSFYFIQQVNTGNLMSPFLWLVMAGGILCLTQFSSASALKYMPLFWSAVVYEKYKLYAGQGVVSGLYSLIKANDYYAFSLCALVLASLVFMVAKLSYKKIVILIYKNQAPLFLNKMISGREKFSLEHYLEHAKKKFKQVSFFAVLGLFFLLLFLSLLGFLWVVSILVGFSVVFVLLTLPNIKESFGIYFDRFKVGQIQTKSHFRLYVDYFAKKGITVSKETRGGGLKWVPRIFFRMAPVHTVIFIVCLVFYVFAVIVSKNTNMAVGGAAIFILSLSPIMWAEATGAPQIGRSYSPGLVGMFLFVGYSFHLFYGIYAHNLIILLSILGITVIVNGKIFFSDIYPARMTITNLMKQIDSLKIKRLYTYRTNYNKSFVEGVPGIAVSDYVPSRNTPAPFQVIYIESIADVVDGWIAIPGTSSKAVNMSTEKEGVIDGDYTKDLVLNRLLETKDIEKIATVKFKTYGTSRIWTHEDEVPTYRDLILHEITKKDLWRGYAWLLHTDNLKKLN
ncbi:MAG: hypothetical protein A3I26_00470 [Candidatus Yanofskybacteria bacterium RIFCSPLOWO2_02_FULL_43_10]|uniref:Glycosyltransferase RgtA/B/C/D-like domain-containing protein n=1 Tax=Candidatus Yanofskybacteria bacterium RIFCSPLOWO2_12_FULL_43_11b TaxID=1802710 RepID=A0A1F8H7I3_9BACT|nr:MAG: hypothetical protein A2742_00180 [Candidatus Yanofskybacteria bacterium RIFCSPHIGHO2_01_FULL_43_32]OGN10982.1 MAG: hypothetical protein A3C69_03320 [Candidatus Yanofskybacteria bacterium RIFCSPHIGHO2_02_FULL_43_12]OGN17129.1 MAG: hypothetical protein A3E34_03635 [Candidatus Yanofskybacteria bacterium RIFCSPHIGHO2_12_FULL_43_11]OGN24110.1 MAG: hypothetical protein A2923_02120 [Candidatus Yanofskybacteria bacterium RIFCSPLOWO2_01_FULL_43_46]OGN30574.1 MAG: hypothetical protein A3I26_00470